MQTKNAVFAVVIFTGALLCLTLALTPQGAGTSRFSDVDASTWKGWETDGSTTGQFTFGVDIGTVTTFPLRLIVNETTIAKKLNVTRLYFENGSSIVFRGYDAYDGNNPTSYNDIAYVFHRVTGWHVFTRGFYKPHFDQATIEASILALVDA